MKSASPSMIAPLRHRLFLAVWIANLVSNCGAQIQSVGASWLMATMTESPQLVALVTTATLLPILVFSLPFGAIADLFDRRKVLLTAQSLMFVAAASLAVLALTGFLNAPTLLILTFILGCGFALNSPAWQASVGDFVPRSDLPAAVSLNILSLNLARTVAPALGGMIVAWSGPQAAFAINAVSYFALIVVLATWRRPAVPTTIPRETIGGAIAGGLRYVGNARGIGRIILQATLFGLCLSAILALLPLVVRDLLGGTPEMFGALLGCTGGGAVVGAMLAGWLRARFSVETVIRGGQVMTAAAVFGVSQSESTILTGLAQMLIGMGMVLTMTSFNITMQLSVPRWIVGRAMSVFQMGGIGGLAIGAWMWGGVAEVAGIRTTLELSALALFLVSMAGLRFPIIQPNQELLQPGKRIFPHALPAGDEDSRAPVSVTIEFRIAAEDHDQFFQLMRERRQIRRREGARRWSISQDAVDSDLWIERYLRSSWADFVRHRDRRTVEEETNIERVAALHRGEERPRLRFFIERDVGQAPNIPVGPELHY